MIDMLQVSCEMMLIEEDINASKNYYCYKKSHCKGMRSLTE